MKKRKLFIMACSTLIAAGLCSCGETTVPPIDDAANPGIVVHEAGIKVRKLSEGTDTDGKPYIVVGYTLTPSDTTHVHFFLTVAFQDQNAVGTATDYVTATIDESAKTVKIKKVQDFDEVVVVTITDLADTTKKASVEVHLKQKFLGWPATNQQNPVTFEDVSEKHVPAQSSNPFWYGLKSGEFSPTSYTGNGFSTTFTDAMSAAEKEVSITDVTVTEAKYYKATGLTQTTSSVGGGGQTVTSTFTRGPLIGSGTTNTQTISYVPYYGSASSNFVGASTGNAAVRQAIDIDTATWTNEQKVSLAIAEGIELVVSGGVKLTVGTTESQSIPFQLSFVLANADYYDFIADYVPLTSIQAESSDVTF